MEAQSSNDDLAVDLKKKKADWTGLSLVDIPNSHPSFSVLHVLDLSRNKISKLSEAFVSMVSLKVLDMSENKVTALDGHYLPRNLEELNASRNELKEVSLVHLKLKRVDLSQNLPLLTVSSIPDSLSVLDLSDTPARGFPPRSAAEEGVVKGMSLTRLKRWMDRNRAEPTHRLYMTQKDEDEEKGNEKKEDSQSSFFIDVTYGVVEDVVVKSKPMEDRNVVYMALAPSCSAPQAPLVRAAHSMMFGVFDGHLGTYAADFAVDHLQARLKRAGLFGAPQKKPSQIIAETIQAMDDELCGVLWDLKKPDGSTVTVAHVSPTGLLTVCWLGDSRAILGRGDGSHVALTKDHKPDDEDELIRIEAAGGHVSFKGVYRVNGVLAMSRSIGDVVLKRPNKAVSNQAAVTVRQLEPGDEFLILASDGLWDVCSNDLAARTCRSCKTPQEAATKLMRIAKTNNTRDNTTIMCVRFDFSKLSKKE